MNLLSLVLAVLLMAPCAVFAEPLKIGDVMEKLPELKQGVAYSLADSKLNYLSTIEALTWKGVSLELGYAGAAENTGNKIVAVVSYPIVSLKELGVTMPILDLVEFNAGVYAGYGRIESISQLQDSEFDYGLSLTAISLKW